MSTGKHINSATGGTSDNYSHVQWVARTPNSKGDAMTVFHARIPKNFVACSILPPVTGKLFWGWV